MRISLLLQREPFGRLVEETMAGFWSARHGHTFQVQWAAGRPSGDSLRPNGHQPWLANIYLNAIFTPDAVPAIFDPVRREFSRSTVWWKRPLQRTYVSLAAQRPAARWLAQATLHVTPAVPGAAHKLIVAGNYKMRLLDRQAGLAYGIRKAGFRSNFMQRELAARRQAADLRLRVPPLVGVAGDLSWFSEYYISGTPLNRLADSEAVSGALRAALRDLHRFHCQTRQTTTWRQYCADLARHIERLLPETSVLGAAGQERLHALSRRLSEQLAPFADNSLTTAVTHGDLQPANILVNDDGVWLIDWEYAGRRQAGYDALVLGLGVRNTAGLATRLGAFIARGWPINTPVAALSWPGLDVSSPDARRRHATLLLLEELVLRLEENAQPALTRADAGLRQLPPEIEAWLAALSEPAAT